jgi:hypothetical protein
MPRKMEQPKKVETGAGAEKPPRRTRRGGKNKSASQKRRYDMPPLSRKSSTSSLSSLGRASPKYVSDGSEPDENEPEQVAVARHEACFHESNPAGLKILSMLGAFDDKTPEPVNIDPAGFPATANAASASETKNTGVYVSELFSAKPKRVPKETAVTPRQTKP